MPLMRSGKAVRVRPPSTFEPGERASSGHKFLLRTAAPVFPIFPLQVLDEASQHLADGIKLTGQEHSLVLREIPTELCDQQMHAEFVRASPRIKQVAREVAVCFLTKPLCNVSNDTD